MARKNKKSMDTSVLDLFDDVATEPVRMGESGPPLVGLSAKDPHGLATSTVSFEGVQFSDASLTTSGD
jgi:hypothetical protein